MGFEIVDDPPEHLWREALRRRSDALIFQSPEMFDVFRQATGIQPAALAAIDSVSGAGLACLAWVRVEPSGWLARALLTRCICQGGPVYEPGSERGLLAARALVARHVELLRDHTVYSQFRNAYEDTGIPEALDGLGEPEPHCNFIIDLSRGLEAIWRGMSSGRRKGIGRAQRRAISVSRVVSSADVTRCYELFELTYRRARLPLFDESLFQAASRLLGDQVRFYLAEREADTLAARALLLNEHTMYDWFAGSTDEGDAAGASELIVWQALQDACAVGLRRFDFGGGGNPHQPYGPREFKRRFGGTTIEYQRFVVRHAPVRYRLVSAGLKLRR